MATIKGTNLGDTLYGTSAADVISGLGGDDIIKGGGGADRIDGGTGNDTVFYTDSRVGVAVNLLTGRGIGGTADGDSYVSVENARGSSFNDTLIGDDGTNHLFGLDGNDVLNGGGGTDSLDGGSGDDILKGGGGADVIAGGAGIDTVDYSQAGSGVHVDLVVGRGFGIDADGDTFSSIENITGSLFNDVITGSDVANWLRGGDGADELHGGAGDDTLDGGNDADNLDGGGGADTMIGGAGDDIYTVDNAGDVVVEDAGPGDLDQVIASVSYTLPANAEIEVVAAVLPFTTSIDFTGNDFDQQLSGNDGSNVLQGLGGNDGLSGNGGFDRLFGGIGQDLLVGGAGADDLIGGSGADQFLYFDAADTGIIAGEFDVIHDFDPTEGDKINVALMDSNPLVPGTQDWTFVGATTSFTVPGQIGFSSDGVDTFILFNTDNDAIQESTIRILGLHTVDANWFAF
jgi:Ca2+-binding RTX toxin-like protein